MPQGQSAKIQSACQILFAGTWFVLDDSPFHVFVLSFSMVEDGQSAKSAVHLYSSLRFLCTSNIRKLNIANVLFECCTNFLTGDNRHYFLKIAIITEKDLYVIGQKEKRQGYNSSVK